MTGSRTRQLATDVDVFVRVRENLPRGRSKAPPKSTLSTSTLSVMQLGHEMSGSDATVCNSLPIGNMPFACSGYGCGAFPLEKLKMSFLRGTVNHLPLTVWCSRLHPVRPSSTNSASCQQGLLIWCVGAVACRRQQQRMARSRAFDVLEDMN